MNSISEYIQLSGGHKIYVRRVGDFSKQDIVFLHGGPGLACSERDEAFFDFRKCNVLFIDQRGSGKSQAKHILNENTSDDLVLDIKFVIERYKLKDVILFGGSWGSLLALLYSIKHPLNIRGLILRGLFLGSQEDREYLEGGGTKNLRPKAWNRYKSMFPNTVDEEVMSNYFQEILQHTLRQERLAYELNLYLSAIGDIGTEIAEIEKNLEHKDLISKSIILAHYTRHGFFVPDGWIQERMSEINHLPIKIIHGKEDYITLIEIARKIKLRNHNVDLIETPGGHSPFDPKNAQELKRAVEEMILKN